EQVVIPLDLEEVAVLDQVAGARVGERAAEAAGVRVGGAGRRLISGPRRLLGHRADARVDVRADADVDRAVLVDGDGPRRFGLRSEDQHRRADRRRTARESTPRKPVRHRNPLLWIDDELLFW